MALAPPETRIASDARGFELRVQLDREKVYVKPIGELDLATVSELRKQVEDMIAIGLGHVIIDLRELSFIDATGLTLLLSLTTTARRDGWQLSLIQGPGAVRRIFALTNTLKRLPFTAAALPPPNMTDRDGVQPPSAELSSRA